MLQTIYPSCGDVISNERALKFNLIFQVDYIWPLIMNSSRRFTRKLHGGWICNMNDLALQFSQGWRLVLAFFPVQGTVQLFCRAKKLFCEACKSSFILS